MLFKKKKPKGPKFSSASSMAPPSLSTLLPHARHSFLPPTNPNITHRHMLSLRPSHSLSFAARFSSDKQNDSTTDNRITYPPAQPPAPPPPEKKSFAVATGELFLGIASRETTPLAGSSAGAIVCAVIASGASMHEALTATKVLAEDCRLKGTAFRLGAVLRDVLERFLPDDVHIRSNGRVRVAVTQILWRPRGLLVDQFDSKEDLINAVVTSSFIPGYLAPRPATMFRNRLCIDGGLTLFMPPTSAAQTVRICAFPVSQMGLQGIGISPDCNPENRATPRELFKWALEPAEDHVLDRLFELGYLDAAVWAEENPVQNVVQDDCPLVENGSSTSP
ncbi:hypothetical protein D5086_001890 [Populus alba]|uniref:Uncharacterized protein n=1 Tax=Populus alba TaxID=43335 RepID=A0ACC4D167_POPAL